MGNRSQKVRAIGRMLGPGTGIPMVHADHRIVEMPYPYHVSIVTGMAALPAPLHEAVRALPHTGVPFVVHHTNYDDSVSDARVILRLERFLPLLTLHYEHGAAARAARE